MKEAVVLITGGASGIGRAIARAVNAAGARVILWDVNDEALRATASEMGSGCLSRVVDLADPAAFSEAEKALDELPPTHLVNNAGVVGRTMALDALDPDEIDRVMAINLRGTLCTTSAFLRRRAAHAKSAIVNLSSIAGTNGGAPGHAVYGATKSAIIALTTAMARDLAPDVRVNALAPGIIDTAMQSTIFTDADELSVAANAIPLRRIGQPEEVAEAARWLLFDADYVTGEVVRVAGGRR